MARRPKLENVKFVTAKGRTYAYFNTGQKLNGKTVYNPLPDPSGVGFWDSYAAMKGARTKRGTAVDTVANLARDFEYSAKFKTRAIGTQIAYSKMLARISKLLGNFPANALERIHVTTVIEREIPGIASQKLFVAVLGAVFAWGRDQSRTALEPTKGIARQKSPTEHHPWPDSVLETALEAENDRVRLGVRLLYYTGQRIGDVLAMRWSDVNNDEISIIQQKTGKRVWIPLHSELRAELAGTPKRGLTIIASENGRSVQAQLLRRDLQLFTAAMGVKTVPHGLRKNAVNALLTVGCSVAEVAAITGQSYAMVEHYAKEINVRKLGRAAIFKLENKNG